MIPSSSIRRPRLAFTLVELLVVIAIISLLAGIALPSYSHEILKAQSTQCSENLRGIGIAVLSDATDNGDVIPEIDQAATNVYTPAGSVLGLVGTLSHYGVNTNNIQCPVDMNMGSGSSFQMYGSSYEWNPVFDDDVDPVTAIQIGTITIDVNSSRVRLCTDFMRIHNGKMNALYEDGHVKAR